MTEVAYEGDLDGLVNYLTELVVTDNADQHGVISYTSSKNGKHSLIPYWYGGTLELEDEGSHSTNMPRAPGGMTFVDWLKGQVFCGELMDQQNGIALYIGPDGSRNEVPYFLDRTLKREEFPAWLRERIQQHEIREAGKVLVQFERAGHDGDVFLEDYQLGRDNRLRLRLI